MWPPTGNLCSSLKSVNPLVAPCFLLPSIALMELAFCASHLAWKLKLSNSLSCTAVFQLFICFYSHSLHLTAFHWKLVESLRANDVCSTLLILSSTNIYLTHYWPDTVLSAGNSQWDAETPCLGLDSTRSRSGNMDSCASSLFASWCPESPVEEAGVALPREEPARVCFPVS